MNPKVMLVRLIPSLLLIMPAHAKESGFSVGVTAMVGGRYDNLRMCVASPAGVKGGPIADIMLVTRYHVSSTSSIGLKLPVMRPILFAAAFKMLQFEPEILFERTIRGRGQYEYVAGPSLGISLHYGPDYTASLDESGAEAFFAAGPVVSGIFGLRFINDAGHDRVIALKPFYIPLFSRERATGTVWGAALEGRLDFF